MYKWIFAGIILLTAVYEIFSRKRALKNIRENLKKNFGEIPTSESNLESAQEYFEQISKDIPKENLIDMLTWNDLDMDSVFQRINCCNCSAGEEVLFETPHTVSDTQALSDFEELMEEFNNEDKRMDVQMAICSSGFLNYNGIISRIKNGD